jgi:hypothetical protein
MAYVTGGFDFPTSTGNYDVELGIEPVGVIMIGGNQATVGTLLTGLSGPCTWMSLNGLDLYGSGMLSITFCIQSNTAAGTPYVAVRGAEIPISVPAEGTNPNTIDYRADTITFLPTGFRLHVTHAAPSRRPIHYIAFGEDDLEAAAVQGEFYGRADDTYPFLPTTLVTMSHEFTTGAFLTSAIAEATLSGEEYLSVGSGNYPQGSPTWQDVRTHTVFGQGRLAGAVGREGFLEDHVWNISTESPDSGLGLPVAHTLGLLVVLQEGYRRYRPVTLGSNTLRSTETSPGGSPGSAETALVWNGHGWCSMAATPATYNVPDYLSDAAEDFGEFKAILFTSINGSMATGASWQMRFGYGVLGADLGAEIPYQGCVTMGQDGSFYQSVTECAANVQTAAGGVHSAVGEIDGDQFSLAVEKGSGFSGSWQAWGEVEDTPTTWQRRRYAGRL